MAVTINVLNAGNMTLTTGPATTPTRIWWSDDESDYSDCPSNNGTFDNSCFPEGKYNFDAVKVEFGSDVTSIGDLAFSGCSSLTNVTIPESVESIEVSAFSDCWGLTSVTISNGVMSIGNEAFKGCRGLTSVTIGNGVTSIGQNAFESGSELTNVTFNGKDKATVQGMTNYPWGLDGGADVVTVHCEDQDYYIYCQY